jgi:hypothetical protein
MSKYLIYAVCSSFIMPIFVALFGRHLNEILVLITWPSSIVLMSLGGKEQTIGNIIYVWGVAVSINTVLYVFLTYIVMLILKLVR